MLFHIIIKTVLNRSFLFRQKKYKHYINIMVFTLTNTIGKYAKNPPGGGGN